MVCSPLLSPSQRGGQPEPKGRRGRAHRLFVPWETDDFDLGSGQPSVCSLSQLFYF